MSRSPLAQLALVDLPKRHEEWLVHLAPGQAKLVDRPVVLEGILGLSWKRANISEHGGLRPELAAVPLVGIQIARFLHLDRKPDQELQTARDSGIEPDEDESLALQLPQLLALQLGGGFSEHPFCLRRLSYCVSHLLEQAVCFYIVWKGGANVVLEPED